MNKKTRLLILLFCVICFLTAAPFLIGYSMGYRFDFEKKEIVGTGGIYVRTFPSADQIIIDYKTFSKPGFFSNAVFVQSLLPKEHTISIEKDGYYGYSKTLPVEEKTVTKLENITLFKRSLAFETIAKEIDYFSISPDNQNVLTAAQGAKSIELKYFNINKPEESKETYAAVAGKVLDIKWHENSPVALIKIQVLSDILYYNFDASNETPVAARLPYLDKNSQQVSFNPENPEEIFYEENNILYSLKNNTPKAIIKNLISYDFLGNNFLWLSSEGSLNESSLSGALISTKNEEKINLSLSKEYKISNVSGKIFLQDSDSTLLFDQSAKTFESFPVARGSYEILISPDKESLVFWNEEKIYIYLPQKNGFTENNAKLLFAGSETSNCQWLNNHYIIFNAGDKIIISEIDYRGNTNTVSLPQTKSPQTLYINQSGKLYILTEKILIMSEKLTP